MPSSATAKQSNSGIRIYYCSVVLPLVGHKRTSITIPTNRAMGVRDATPIDSGRPRLYHQKHRANAAKSQTRTRGISNTKKCASLSVKGATFVSSPITPRSVRTDYRPQKQSAEDQQKCRRPCILYLISGSSIPISKRNENCSCGSSCISLPSVSLTACPPSPPPYPSSLPVAPVLLTV